MAKHKFVIEVLSLPIVWVLMILKILVFIPRWVISNINTWIDENLDY